MIALMTTALFSGCAKDGETGPAGANGTNGNANVILAVFDADTFSVFSTYFDYTLPAPVTGNMLDSSMILVYHQNSNCSDFWYFSPGLGCYSTYNMRVYASTVGTPSIRLIMQDPDGTIYSGTDQIFTKVKIVVAPSSDFLGLRSSVDLSDYSAVMRYYNLSEED